MKKKEEVYLVVDTQKKAKNLQKVLDIFKEPVFSKESIKNCIDSDLVMHYDGEEWLNAYLIEDELVGKQKVSIKELRNILAVEHLKEGDVVVLGIGTVEYVATYKRFDGNYFESIDYYMIGGSGENRGSCCFDNFIRYATEEEKALLDPKEEKKELLVGKWYKTENALFNHQNGCNSYGFSRGVWLYGDWMTNRDVWANDVVEATPQEVKQALVKEAEKRYKVGDNIKSFDLGEFTLDGLNLMYSEQRNVLYATYGVEHIVFNNGKWAEVLPQPSAGITDQDINTLEDLANQARVLADKLRELQTKTK